MAVDSSTDDYVESDSLSDSLESDVEGRTTVDQIETHSSHQELQLHGQISTSEEPAPAAHNEPADSNDVASASGNRSGDQTAHRRRSSTEARSRQSRTAQDCETSRVASDSVEPATGTVGTLTTEYRDLLNEMIADASGQVAEFDTELSSSQVGATFWSSSEKRVLFHALEKYGAGELQRLENDLRTKSQYEIQVYLSVLRKSLVSSPSSVSPHSIQLRDIPTAAEIAPECERALNAVADALSSRVEKHEQLAEHTKLQDRWLIDVEAAEREEQDYEETAVVEADVPKDVDAASDSDCGGSARGNLLRHAMLLQLSRNIFMNHGEQDELNWHYVDRVTDVTSEPAIFRRAAEDLQDIVVSLTRRLVQVSMFQAMSRLRASDSSRADWTPLAAVRDVDVRAAAQLLDMSTSWQDYWAKVARRCRVKVYSDAKRFNDGRPGTKSGYRLTYDELETELGMEQVKPSSSVEKDSSDILEEDVDELMNDSDAFTDDPNFVDCSPNANSDTEGQDVTYPMSSTRRQKRKRPQNPDDLAATEDQCLEILDSGFSTQEQARLWKTLRITPADSLTNASVPNARPPVKRATSNEQPVSHNWRATLGYAAEWELESGPPRPEDFEDMTLAGHGGRKRRRLLEARVKARLVYHGRGRLGEMSGAEGPETGEAVSDDGENVSAADDERDEPASNG